MGFKLMNILITGGLGYVGGRVASYLKEKEPEVNIFFTTSKKRTEYPAWSRGFTILEMDLLDETSINSCLKDKGIDVIIHLAALNEIESAKDPNLALEVNAKGTYNLLNLAQANNINKFIYFSTFHVYGKNIVDEVITEETPTQPFHPYAISKLKAEDYVRSFRQQKGMQTLIFRLSNGYGYPMDKNIDRWTLVFNDLCRQIATTGKIKLKSSGKQHRDFVSLRDVSRAVHHFLFKLPNNWGDGLYNLGGDCSMSIMEVAKKIAQGYKKPDVEIETQPDTNSSAVFQPVKYSIEKLLKTGFELEGDMDYEIKKTVELIKENVI